MDCRCLLVCAMMAWGSRAAVSHSVPSHDATNAQESFCFPIGKYRLMIELSGWKTNTYDDYKVCGGVSLDRPAPAVHLLFPRLVQPRASESRLRPTGCDR